MFRVIFVGAFEADTDDNRRGGILHESRLLIKSGLSESVTWLPLDSTMRSIPPPPLLIRFHYALRRIYRFLHWTGTEHVDIALIFTSAHFSFIEKGLMTILAHWGGKAVALSPRSGFMVDSISNSELMRRYVIFVLRRTDRIVCQSTSWKQFYQKLSGLPDERFVVIPNWLDTQPYLQIDCHNSETPRDAVNILFLGWLERNKGILDLIKAVDKYRDKLTCARFVICGDGGARESAERKVRAAGLGALFDFKGWTVGAEKMQALCEADIFVLPSYREGLPNSLLEAMASGLPVIASRAGAIPEVINGSNGGILIDAGNVDALGHALVQMTSDPERRRRMGVNNRKYVISNHDIQVIWPHFLDMFTELAGRHR